MNQSKEVIEDVNFQAVLNFSKRWKKAVKGIAEFKDHSEMASLRQTHAYYFWRSKNREKNLSETQVAYAKAWTHAFELEMTGISQSVQQREESKRTKFLWQNKSRRKNLSKFLAKKELKFERSKKFIKGKKQSVFLPIVNFISQTDSTKFKFKK